MRHKNSINRKSVFSKIFINNIHIKQYFQYVILYTNTYNNPHRTYIIPLLVTSSVQKYMMVIAHRTSQSNVNSMLNLVVAVLSSASFNMAESSGARTKRKLSFLILRSAFSVLLGSFAVGAGYGN